MTDFEPTFCTRTSWIQLGYGLWVNQLTIAVGLAYGFSAIMVPELKHDMNISLAEQAWITSILLISAPIGCMLCGFLMDKIGRRLVFILCPVPMAVGWFIVGASKHVALYSFGRFVKGVGVGMALAPPSTFSAEISLPKMRGVIGVFPSLAISVGCLIMAALGYVFHWTSTSYICGGYTTLLIFINYFLPESPHYLLMSGDMVDVKTALKKFRSRQYNLRVHVEYADLKEYREKNELNKVNTKDIFKQFVKGQSCKQFSIITIYFVVGQMCGTSILMFWTVDMIQNSMVVDDAYLANLMLGSIRCIVGVAVAVAIFEIRRRPMALFSAIGLGIAFIVLGIYLLTHPKPSFAPEILYTLVIAFSTIGYYTLPFLMLFELMPLQIRGILGGISISIWNLALFLCIFLYPFIRDIIGHPSTLLIFGVISLSCAVFLYYYLPETKGLTLLEIEERFRTGSLPSRVQRALNLLDGGYKPKKSAFKKRQSSVLAIQTTQPEDTGRIKVIRFNKDVHIIEATLPSLPQLPTINSEESDEETKVQTNK